MNADGSRQLRLVRGGREPLWSPDGRRLAFTRGQGGGSVYVVNVDGSEERNVTHGPVRDFAWSPDGRRIAFDSARDGNSEIYVVNADGSGLRRLTRNPAHDLAPAWSPDGRRIAFAGAGGIYVMNADGSGQRNLMRSPTRDFASDLVARRAEDRLREPARRQPRGLRHEPRWQRAAESDAQPVARRLGLPGRPRRRSST